MQRARARVCVGCVCVFGGRRTRGKPTPRLHLTVNPPELRPRSHSCPSQHPTVLLACWARVPANHRSAVDGAVFRDSPDVIAFDSVRVATPKGAELLRSLSFKVTLNAPRAKDTYDVDLSGVE